MLGGFSASSLIEGGANSLTCTQDEGQSHDQGRRASPTVSVVVVVLSFAFLLTPPPHCPHTHTFTGRGDDRMASF